MSEGLPRLEPGVFCLEVLETFTRTLAEGGPFPGKEYGVVQFKVLWSSRSDTRLGDLRCYFATIRGGDGAMTSLFKIARQRFDYLCARKNDRVYAHVYRRTLTRMERKVIVYDFADEPFVSPTAQTYINLRMTVQHLETQEGYQSYVEESRKVLNQLFEKLDEEQQRMLVGEEQRRMEEL